MEDLRRIVVTGMGLVTPLGCGLGGPWASLIKGQSGISKISGIDVSDLPSQIAGQVPRNNTGPFSEDSFDPDDYISSKDQKRMDVFIQYGLTAAILAISDSGWEPKDEESLLKTGVMVGSGIGGLPEIEKSAQIVNGGKVRRLSPFFIPASLINLVSGQIAIRYGFKGPNHSVVTACASGAHAIGDSYRMIVNGDADVMVSGGTESACTRFGIAGFCAMRALSTNYNESPEQASRPWDRDRDGFVLSEGSGVLVLEEYEHAKARGAKIYAELTGYGATSDGYDMVAPSGEGAVRCMQMALNTSKNKIDYINTHGTSTPVGDITELKAVGEVFKDNLPKISSTKSLSGHSLGATSVHEAIYSLIMMKNNFISASINITEIDDEAKKYPIITKVEKNITLNSIMSNSFGFGGTNATLVFEKV